jgi:hypothetical protein
MPRKNLSQKPTLWVVHPQENLLEKIRQERFPHLSEGGGRRNG